MDARSLIHQELRSQYSQAWILLSQLPHPNNVKLPTARTVTKWQNIAHHCSAFSAQNESTLDADHCTQIYS